MSSNRILALLGLVVLLGATCFVAVPEASAGPYGATANDSIENARSTDTIPLAPGELSIAVQNGSGDTNYVDTNSVVTTSVDTGFDMTPPTTVAGSLGNGTVDQGNFRVVKFLLANRGNNAAEVPFDVQHHVHGDSVTDPNVKADSFTLELFHMAGDQSFDTNTAQRVTDSAGAVNFAEGDTKSIFLVVTPRDDAQPGDTVQSDLFLTDNAPIGNGTAGTTGDQWENGDPISGEDTNDTQYHNFTTTLQGSNLKVKKSMTLVSGSARPGDTIEYTVTAWNDGTLASDTTTLVDAIPDSTVYVGGSNSSDLGGNSGNTDGPFYTGGGSAVGFDDNFVVDGSGGEDSTDQVSDGELAPDIARVVLDLQSVGGIVNGPGATPGDADTVQFSYRVVIE